MAEESRRGEDRGPGESPVWKWVSPVIGAALFLLAGAFIAHEVRALHWNDVEAVLSATPADAFGLALAAMLVSLACASTFDGLALAGREPRFGWRGTAATSVTAFILGNAGGPGIALATALRFRAYQPCGLKGTDVALVSAGAAIVGLIGGLALLSFGASGVLSDTITSAHLPPFAGALAAFFGIKLVILYVLVPRFGPLNRVLPAHVVRLGQVVVSTVEWTAAATVLYAFLPGATRGGLVDFLPLFALAGLLGAVSGLPGGIGPFDALILTLLGPRCGAAEVIGALLCYRLVYILLPMIMVAVAEAVHLVRRHRHGIGDATRVGSDVWEAVAPALFGMLTFVAGVVMLVSAATPDAAARLTAIARVLPNGLVEISHFIASLAGVALLFLAMALNGKYLRAWVLTLAALVLAAAATLLKGLNYEEAAFLVVLAVLLGASRKAFYRQDSLRAGAFSPGAVVAIVGVLLLTGWLGFFAYRHVEYSDELWWTFVTDQDAPRFLRALVGAGALSLFLLLWWLTNPAKARADATSEAALAKADAVWKVAEQASPDGNLAFLGDKSLFFSDSGQSFIQYVPRGGTWVAMGEPVGRRDEVREMIWAFRDLCDRNGVRPIFYAVRRERVVDFIDCGMVASKIGENAVVELTGFSLDGPRRAPLRHALNRAGRDGAEFGIVAPEAFGDHVEAFRDVSESWLAFHRGTEKGFSLGRFDEAYLSRFPIAVIRREGRIVAFANIWATPDRKTLSIDLMRYDSDAPKNVMDVLFVHLMQWGRDQGYAEFDLGMAPLAGLEDHHLARGIDRVGRFLFYRGEGLYGFQGLRAFKDKFDPRWEGSYIAAPTGWLLLPALADAALLSSGGVMGLLR